MSKGKFKNFSKHGKQLEEEIDKYSGKYHTSTCILLSADFIIWGLDFNFTAFFCSLPYSLSQLRESKAETVVCKVLFASTQYKCPNG